MSQDTVSTRSSLFPDLTYAEAVASVLADAATRYSLRDRIRADQDRDPVDCVSDAQVLLALNARRLDELLGQAPAREVH